MKDEAEQSLLSFRLHPLFFPVRRRSQVVRQRSAKPLFIGSIPIAASNHNLNHCALSKLNFLNSVTLPINHTC